MTESLATERGLPVTQMIMCLMTWRKMSLWSCQHVYLDHQLHWMIRNIMVLYLPVLPRGPPHPCYHLHITPTPLPRCPGHCDDLYTLIQVLRHRLPPPSKIYTLSTTPLKFFLYMNFPWEGVQKPPASPCLLSVMFANSKIVFDFKFCESRLEIGYGYLRG